MISLVQVSCWIFFCLWDINCETQCMTLSWFELQWPTDFLAVEAAKHAFGNWWQKDAASEIMWTVVFHQH